MVKFYVMLGNMTIGKQMNREVSNLFQKNAKKWRKCNNFQKIIPRNFECVISLVLLLCLDDISSKFL